MVDIEMEMLKMNSVNRIMNNPDFISWLCVFSSKNVYFTNNESDLRDFSVRDRANIRYLGIFYEIVSEYAKRNYINSEDVSFIVSYKNHAFIIGYDDKYIFCKSVQYDSVLDCIDFMDIRNGKPSKHKRKIDNMLKILPIIIRNIHRYGASADDISNVVNATLKSIDEESKKLVK